MDAEARVADIVEALRQGDRKRAQALVEASLQSHPEEVEARRIDFAHLLLLSAGWETASALLPRGTNLFAESGWLDSVLGGRPVDREGNPLPWLTYPAIDFLEPRLRPEMRVFEYGSGMSTRWWSERVREVRAVEHDPEWFSDISGQLPSNAAVRLASDERSYVDAIHAEAGLFDVVVIDGEYRNACARAVGDKVSAGGMVVFDNSDREGFSEGVEHLSADGWLRIDFFGMIPCYVYKNCTSIFFRDPALLAARPAPSRHALSSGRSCAQALGE